MQRKDFFYYRFGQNGRDNDTGAKFRLKPRFDGHEILFFDQYYTEAWAFQLQKQFPNSFKKTSKQL